VSDEDFSHLDDFNDSDLGGAGDSWDDDEGFRVDFSEKEASAEAFGGDLIPKGWYETAIVEINVEESKSPKNPGKPMFAVTHAIQGGPFHGRRVYDRWCLWSGALYSVSMAMKAVDVDPNAGRIPPAKWWMGKRLLTQIGQETKKEKDEATNQYTKVVRDAAGKAEYQNTCKGYKKVPADWDPNKGHAVQQAAQKKAAEDTLAP